MRTIIERFIQAITDTIFAVTYSCYIDSSNKLLPTVIHSYCSRDSLLSRYKSYNYTGPGGNIARTSHE